MSDPRPAVLYDGDLEHALLASIIADNGRIDRLAGLGPDDLYDPINAAILRTALDLREERVPANLVTLKGRFGSVPFRDGGTVFDYIKGLQFAGAEPAFGDLVSALRDLALRREGQALLERRASAMSDMAASPAHLLLDGARELDDLLARCRQSNGTLRTMPEAIDDMLDAIRTGDKADLIPSGFADLDRLIGGLERGAEHILGGRPSMGKSALGIALALRAAKAGHGVLIFSLEMSARHVMARMASDAAWTRENGVSYSAALLGKLEGRALERFVSGAQARRALPMLIDDASGLTAADICSRTRKAREHFDRIGKRLGLVVVDHLGKVRPSSRYAGKVVYELSELSNAMAHLAKSEDAAVLVLHQLSRALEGRENKRPHLSDLRDSGALEQDAETVMFVYRQAYYLERMREDDPDRERLRLAELEAKRSVIEVHVAKKRNGTPGVVELYADMAANAVRDSWRGAA